MSGQSKTYIKSAAPNPEPLYPWQKLTNKETTIGVVKPCYGSSHVIFGLGSKKYSHRTLLAAPLSRLDNKTTFFKFTPFILDRSVPLVHTWNMIPLNKQFIISYELELPRYLKHPSEKQIKFGMGLMEGKRCHSILALSEFARLHAIDQFNKYGFPHLQEKLQVFRGAIIDPVERFSLEPAYLKDRSADAPLTAVVIGTQLFRKGGMHAIEAFEALRNMGMDVRLTLIGDFETRSYAFGEFIPDADEWRKRAASHDWIRVLPPIPNAQVFEELRAHDICLYPSLDESLGWLPIEAAMLGIPVVGCRIAAFPEFVDHMHTGYLINLPLGSHRRWQGIGMQGDDLRNELDAAHETVVQGIIKSMQLFMENPGLLSEFGKNGREMMLSMYGVKEAADKLDAIYDEALGRMPPL